MFRLQVDAPLDRELEFLVRPLEHLDRLAVIHMHEFRMHEFRADDLLDLRDQPLLDALVEEGKVFLPFGNAEGVFQQSFHECRIVPEIGERDLQLDHPELGEVAAEPTVTRGRDSSLGRECESRAPGPSKASDGRRCSR